MEYEQVEYGRRVVMEAITRQDINGYYDLLSPEVLLVTHFPYPTTSSDSNMQAIQQWVLLYQPQRQGSLRGSGSATMTAAVGGHTSRRRVRELLQLQETQRARQQKRYEDFRKRREGHHGASTGDLEKVKASTVAAAGEKQGGPAAAATTVQADGTRSDTAAAATSKSLKKNSTKTRGGSSDGGSVGRGSASARVPLGVRWFRQQQQQQQQQGSGSTGVPQQSPMMPGRVGAAPAQASLAAVTTTTTTAVQSVTPGDEAANTAAALSYEDVVDIAEGRLLVSFRFFELLHWICTGKHTSTIAPVELDVQLRKDILQEDEVLPLPPAPSTEQEQYEQLGTQHTERNQPLSRIAVVWGSDYLLFRDKIYIDDGLIVTIQRTMLSVREVVARAPLIDSWNPQQQQQQQQAQSQQQQQQQQQPRLSGWKGHATGGSSSPSNGKVQSMAAAQAERAYKAVEAFYGASASRVNSLNTSWALLDFSFVEAPEPSSLLRLAPASGHVHVDKPPRAAADPRLAQGVFLNQSNDPTAAAAQAGESRTLIKAKNKRGEEEAYEFSDKHHRLSFLQHDALDGGGDGDGVDGEKWGLGTNPSTTKNSGGGGADGDGKGHGDASGAGNAAGSGAARAPRYDAACVRVSGCHLQYKMEQLVPVLRRLIANSLLTLHTLDLSQNHITTLPDLRLLPLQNLKLHDNAIADWRVVEHYIAPLPYLAVLTLHGNPIAEEKEAARPANVAATVVAAAAAKHKKNRAGPVAASTPIGESAYWKKLLAMLLGNPARVAPLRQVDFVTLTAQDLNVAGAHVLFTTGKADVLNWARTLNAGGSRYNASVTAATAAGDAP